MERSFSYLQRLLRPERSRFTDDNLALHLQIKFNSRNFVAEVSFELDGEGDDENEMEEEEI